MIKEKATLDSICENFINMVMDLYDIPGIAVGVYYDPYKYTATSGFSNYETKTPLQTNTVFHCTSVSKLFTATGIMKLAEQGKLNLSDKLCDIIPWVSIADKRWEDITIDTMLTHTSGLTDVSDYHWEEHITGENALREYALSDEVAGRKLLWEPGAGFRYSSKAYDLLGLVITEVSGMAFEAFIKREIFDPLCMDDTTFLMPNEANLAMPHSKGRDRVMRLEETYPYTRQHAPSSTLKSTTEDLLKWAASLLQPAGLRDMWTPRVEVPDTGEQMGLGWFIKKQSVTVGADGDDGSEMQEYALVGHEGSDDGFRTSFWMCPELGVATVLLCNLTDAPLKKLNKKLFSMIMK